MVTEQPSDALNADFIGKFIHPVIERFESRSRGAKRKWQWFEALQYFFILLTPIIGGLLPFFHLVSEGAIQASTGVSGFVAAYLTHVVASGNYKKNFVQYEATRSALDVQYALFSAGSSPYDTPNARNVFVTNFEKIVSDEEARWAQEMLGSTSTSPKGANP